MYRVGIGYDVHRLVKRRKLILGGVKIPYSKGLLGHSDADVLSHAICDALLGAAGLKDIGEHFPNTSLKYKGISSIKLLKEVHRLLKKSKYAILNIDVIVLAERPKLAPFKSTMCKKIAKTLNISNTKVNVKATTTEGLGQIGKGAAISAYAITLLEKR